MRRSLVLMIIGILCFSMFQFVHFAVVASEVPAIEWSKRYSGAFTDPFEGLPYLVAQTNDNGYAIAGCEGTVHPWSYWLIKTDSYGNVLWNKTYECAERERLWRFVQTSEGGYALAGDLPDSGSGLLTKTDSDGNMQWNKTYPHSSVRSVIQTEDGGYALACIVGGAGNDGTLIRTDSEGTVLWTRTYGGAGNDQFESVVETSDGGFALAGASQSYSVTGNTEAWLLKTDSDGNMLWNKTFGRTAGHDYGCSMIQTNDGGFALAGQTDYFSSGDAWLVKTDSDGNMTWNNTYDGRNSDSAVSIARTTDGGYALGGQIDFWQNGDAWLIKTNSNGIAQWNETFGGTGYDRGCSAIQTNDGGYALSGFTNSFSGDGSYQVWLIKLRGSGPKTWSVDDDSPADFSTIQGAINAAWDGDTVSIRAGIYHENLLVINKSLRILGESWHNTSISYQVAGDEVFRVTADDVEISNFLLIGHSSWGTITAFSVKNFVASNNFITRDGGSANGIYFADCFNTTIIGNIFSSAGVYGLTSDASWGGRIENNTIDSSGVGMYLAWKGNNTIKDNTMMNLGDYAIRLLDSDNNTVYHNNLIDNTPHISLSDSSNAVWDDGYPSGGNFWSDYNGTDANDDGIGDTPYIVDANNTDNYPLMNPWAPPDIAVRDLSTSKTIIGQGYTSGLNVTLENQGNKIEAFNTSVYANSTVIYSESIMLAMTNQTLSFLWNTTGFAYGNYTFTAHAEPLLEELDVLDNNCTCSFAVHIGVPGDISGPTLAVYDGTCNMRDIQYLILRFNTNPSSPNWNPNADINNDGTCNMRDIQIAILNFNRHE